MHRFPALLAGFLSAVLIPSPVSASWDEGVSAFRAGRWDEAAAAFEAGFTCQAFPAFGAERRGAPVMAFVRIDEKPITLRSQVRSPDFMIVQDDTLLLDPNLTNGLKPNGATTATSANSW